MTHYNDHLNVPSNGVLPEAGKILVATPYFNDLYFNRSVVLLTDLTEEATCGLIINKQLPTTVRRMVNEIRVDDPIYFGGPVEPEAIFLLHSFQNCKDSSKLLNDVYIGYDNILLSIIEHDAIPNLKSKFLIGYAGWSPGQLEDEILRDMWVVGEASHSLIFNTPAEQIWKRAVQNLGPSYAHWLNIPEKLHYN